ncbi:hypothetical protein BSZ39_06265 [Bowdeniella nasicola]|uniref:Unsaturated chondroitin disaccharide hydrolase n=1 Tax=Bowdeniella nasicola TaxID=208480 RepID=A0A1Q5Q2Z2_9ACTO|nr:hypothetical protein [Bowdeniella nasicola]OKL54059.1 hypothetical protein BSZ39_06265 [Bowdeniella nasicola]
MRDSTVVEELTGSEVVRERRIAEQERMLGSLRDALHYYNHDLGFIGILAFSGNPATLIAKATEARELCRTGLEALVHPPSGMVDTHGADPLGEARAIVDSFMNVPLLLTPEATVTQREVAFGHLKRMAAQLRVDTGKWYQGGVFNVQGHFARPFTKQGCAPDSTGWTRGLAWVSYGLRIVRQRGLDLGGLDLAAEITELDRLLLAPARDTLVPWDLAATETDAKDSGALAIALAGHCQFDDGELLADNVALLERAGAIVEAPESGSLLRLSTYHVPHGAGINGSTAWGDYFYLEALASAAGFRSPYHY